MRRQDEVDAVVGYESTVLSAYPLMLLEPGKRAVYDRVVDWLRTPSAQRSIMERTLRRPVDASLERVAQLREPVGTALYFPATQDVVGSLLAAYDRAGQPATVVFVLDHSTSTEGPRIAGLREAFATLGLGGGFDRFRVGETVVLVRFAGTVLEERSVTVRGEADLAELSRVAPAGGGRVVDATSGSLLEAVGEIRGCG